MSSTDSANTPETNSQVFVGRQPVFDRQGDIFAYELLFREGMTNTAGVVDGTQASATVLQNTLMEIGLESIAAGKFSLINFNRELLLSDIPELLPTASVILEILEDVEIDSTLIEQVKFLNDSGFIIALDDFEFSPEWQPLLSLADIIKLDVLALSSAQIQEHLQLLRPFDVKLLAEKVETQADYERLYETGFDYFQGYFFARPTIVSGSKLASNEVALLDLVAKLQNPGADIEDIEKLVAQNVSLSYKLLRLINSASFAPTEPITSLHQAILLFGLKKLRNWASLIALSGSKKHSSELLRIAAVRAKFCESLALVEHRAAADGFFMAGLFSVLDALLDQPMADIVEHLPLNAAIKDALVHGQGNAGQALACALACERCELQAIQFDNFPSEDLYALHVEAMRWAESVIN